MEIAYCHGNKKSFSVQFENINPALEGLQLPGGRVGYFIEQCVDVTVSTLLEKLVIY